jgi:hypothetical protein
MTTEKLQMPKLNTKSNATSNAAPAKTGKVLPTVNEPARVIPMTGNGVAVRVLGADDEFSASFTRNEDGTYTDRFTVKPNKDGQRHVIETIWDFSTATHDELVKMAISGLRIDLQREFRELHATNAAQASRADVWSKRNAHDVFNVERERKTSDPVAKAANAFAKLTDEQKAAIKKQLGL